MTDRALLCPGQGAQLVGMGKECAEAFPECRGLYDRANEVLGYDLARVCFEGPLEALTESRHAQPGIFLSSLACLTALRKLRPDVEVAAAAGLSSGEWTALHLAGAVSFDDTVRVLQARGEYMQAACEEQPGGMLSVIGLDREVLERVCEETGVTLANLNSPEQIVLSGPTSGIRAAEQKVKEAGAKRAIPLNVSGAFHSPLMATAAERLQVFLDGVRFSDPAFPVVSNVTGRPHPDGAGIPERMVRQVTSPVQWVAGIEWLREQGVKEYLECGPGKVLTGLVKRIDKQAVLHNIQDRSSLEAMVQAAGR